MKKALTHHVSYDVAECTQIGLGQTGSSGGGWGGSFSYYWKGIVVIVVGTESQG